MKYRIEYSGTPAGGLNAAFKVNVSRIVEAPDPEAAQLMAYDTHEHIGGSDAVKVTEVEAK